MSQLEALFAVQIEQARLPEPEREYRFCERRWRFDFAWPAQKIAAEVEGGVWTSGRHTRGDGFTKDCEKYNEAARRGWRVFRFTGDMISNGYAIGVLEEVLNEQN